MRKTNEEFAAEVLRRSAEYKRRQITAHRHFRAAAACVIMLLSTGLFFAAMFRLNRMEKSSSGAPNNKDNGVSSELPKESNSKAEPSGLKTKSSALIRISTEHTVYPADTIMIPVTVTNLSSEPISVHPYQFTAKQGAAEFGISVDLADDALKAITVTIEPGASKIVDFRASEYHLKESEGNYILCLLDAETEFFFGNKE